MHTSLINFNYNDNIVRTQVTENSEPLFCLADVCKILDLTNPSKVVQQICEEFELPNLKLGSFDTGYGVKELTLITEPQLYFVLYRSRSEKAKPFRRWVDSEVLPSIRKTGEYKLNQEEKVTESEDPRYRKVDSEVVGEALNKLLDKLNVTGSKRVLAANDFIDDCFHVNFLKVSKLNLSATSTVVDDVPRYTPTELGKPYGLSAQKINKLLEQAGLQYKEGTGWVPTEEGKLQGGVLLSLDGHLAAGSNISQLKWPITVINLIINNSEH